MVVRGFYDYPWRSAARIGEILALFVEDVDVADNQIPIRDREEWEHEAEIKTVHAPRTIDVSSDLIDEMVAYGGRAQTVDVETNHLFLKLSGERVRQAMMYEDVDSLFRRLRQKTGIHSVTPHLLPHTMLTTLAERGWPPQLLPVRAGPASFQQTYQTSVHPTPEALRRAWEQIQEQVRLKTPSAGGRS